MNRNKNHNDWSDVLRERLQDAELPLADGWAGPVVPGRPGPRWTGWAWALAGAAAALAAVLLLRPAAPDGQPGVSPAGPEPVRLVEAPAAGTPGPDTAPDQRVAQAQDQKAGEAPSRNPAATLGRKPRPSTLQAAEPVSSSERAVVGDDEGKEEIPDQVGNDRKGARKDNTVVLSDDQKVKAEDKTGKQQSLEEMTQGDFAMAGEPEMGRVSETAGGRPARRPVSLRLQAAGPGVALASGGQAAFNNVPQSANKAGGYGDYAGTPSQPAQPARPVSRPAPFPISVGVSVALPLSRAWTLAAGLDYTQRAGARSVTATSYATERNVTLHYLGLPLDLHYYFNPESRLRVWLGAGLKAEKCIYVAGADPLRDPVLWSGNLQAGADLRVLPGVRLYVSPALTRYLNHSAYSASWDENAIFSLRAGLSFDLK